MKDHPCTPLPPLPDYDDATRVARAAAFAEHVGRRRTVREY